MVPRYKKMSHDAPPPGSPCAASQLIKPLILFGVYAQVSLFFSFFCNCRRLASLAWVGVCGWGFAGCGVGRGGGPGCWVGGWWVGSGWLALVLARWSLGLGSSGRFGVVGWLVGWSSGRPAGRWLAGFLSPPKNTYPGSSSRFFRTSKSMQEALRKRCFFNH